MFDLILYVPSTIFQLSRDWSSWVEPELSKDNCVLLRDHNAVTLVRLETATPRARVKHSTTALQNLTVKPWWAQHHAPTISFIDKSFIRNRHRSNQPECSLRGKPNCSKLYRQIVGISMGTNCCRSVFLLL